jgi:putative transposase
MEDIYKNYLHNPPHLFRSNAKYIITGSTYLKKAFLKSDKTKIIFLKYLFKSISYFNWKIDDWVVLDNHYHLMVEAPENAKTLSNVINNTHKFSAIAIKKYYQNYRTSKPMEYFWEDMEYVDCVNMNNKNYSSTQSMNSKTIVNSNTALNSEKIFNPKKIFYNYWDSCITYEKSYFGRLHYIWFNPVKHGYVDDPIDWKWGSYYYRFADEGNKLKKIMDNYPCDRINIMDNF